MNFNLDVRLAKMVFQIKKLRVIFVLQKGIFKLEKLYYRKDRVNFKKCDLKSEKINNRMVWCNDSTSIFYNRLTQISKKITYEKMFRNDYKYNLVITLDYNRQKIQKNKGSAIFIHLTKNYKATAGCIAINKNDFEILLKKPQKIRILKLNF